MTRADLGGWIVIGWVLVWRVIRGVTAEEWGVGGWVRSKPDSEDHSQKLLSGSPIMALRLGGAEPMVMLSEAVGDTEGFSMEEKLRGKMY